MSCFLKAAPFPLLLAMVISLEAGGQTLRPGLQLSLSAATFTGESRSDFNLRGAWGAGVTLGISWGGGFSVEPELRYVVKGATTDSTTLVGIPDPIRAKWRIAYLEVPILFVYTFETGRAIRPRLFAGPFYARKLESTIEWGSASGRLTQQESDDSVSSDDYGLIVGGGIELDAGGERLVFGVRATLGRSDIRGRPDAPLHNTGFEFVSGIIFQ